jgi:hypothetical protein
MAAGTQSGPGVQPGSERIRFWSNPKDMGVDPKKVTFDVTIEEVRGVNLVSNGVGGKPSTFLKIKFDEWFTHITTEKKENDDNPVWEGFPFNFKYETMFGRQNHLKVKMCCFEVWDKRGWSGASKLNRFGSRRHGP